MKSFNIGVGAYFWQVAGIEAFLEYPINQNNSLYLTTAYNWNNIISTNELVDEESSTAVTLGLEYRYKYLLVAYELVAAYSVNNSYLIKKATSAYKIGITYPVDKSEFGIFFRQYNDKLLENGSSQNLGWFGRYKF